VLQYSSVRPSSFGTIASRVLWLWQTGCSKAATQQRGGLRVGAIRKQDGDWPPRRRFAASCLPEPLVFTFLALWLCRLFALSTQQLDSCAVRQSARTCVVSIRVVLYQPSILCLDDLSQVRMCFPRPD